jgi:hypothetical protein
MAASIFCAVTFAAALILQPTNALSQRPGEKPAFLIWTANFDRSGDFLDCTDKSETECFGIKAISNASKSISDPTNLKKGIIQIFS